jgi:hypothetical protein
MIWNTKVVETVNRRGQRTKTRNGQKVVIRHTTRKAKWMRVSAKTRARLWALSVMAAFLIGVWLRVK